MLIKVDLATALKKLRGNRTQKEVARRADLSPSTWNQYEKAHRLPKEESWPKLARGLDCSMEELWDEVMAAYQERTGKAAERGSGLGPVVEQLVATMSRQIADRLDEQANSRRQRGRTVDPNAPKAPKAPNADRDAAS